MLDTPFIKRDRHTIAIVLDAYLHGLVADDTDYFEKGEKGLLALKRPLQLQVCVTLRIAKLVVS